MASLKKLWYKKHLLSLRGSAGNFYRFIWNNSAVYPTTKDT